MLDTPIKSQTIGNLYKVVGDPFYVDVNTVDQVRNVLTQVYSDRSRKVRNNRIRVWYGNVKSGRAWNDTFNVAGYMNRTAARYPQPMLVQFLTSSDGEVLATSKIVRIDLVETGETVYAHPNFHVVPFTTLANVKESVVVRRVVASLHRAWLSLTGLYARKA